MLVDCIFIAFVEVTCAFLFSFFLGVVRTILSASSSFFIISKILFISYLSSIVIVFQFVFIYFCYGYVVFIFLYIGIICSIMDFMVILSDS